MNARNRRILATILCGFALVIVATTHAHHVGYQISSPGLPAAAIAINGIEGVGEWTGSANEPLSDYTDIMMPGSPLSGSLKALHKSDGIYLLIKVTDSSDNNPEDSVQIRFDINHNGTAGDASDWGVEIRRDPGQVRWGSGADAATWAPAPNGTAVFTSTPTDWTVEFKLPTGAPSNLALATGRVGMHVQLYDVDQAFGPASAKYTQWPQPDPADLNALLAMTPGDWGDYVFDPATTFPNVAVTGVRRGGGVGPSDYYTISHAQPNTFQVTVNNPGGSAVADATGVRLNLYVGAVGLGEPFHRLDNAAMPLDPDCAAAWNPNASLPQADVCAGAVSLPDVETIPNSSLVTTMAKYTVKNGVTRVGGTSAVITGGATNDINVVTWDTTAGQDPKYDVMTVNGSTYNRKHSCMRAEALVPNDPNIVDNYRQVNMDFACVPGGLAGGAGAVFNFGLGAAAFANYIPSVGQEMFIEVSRSNMNPQLGWNFKLSDPKGQIRQVSDNRFVAQIKGTQSIGAVLDLVAPRPDALGHTLKENLFVPSKAGGRQGNAAIPSGDAPIYVKVNPGSTLLISNFSFHDTEDNQYVDVDGDSRFFPPNGPAGLSDELLKKALQEVAQFKLLLSPKSPLGSLVGSFDNFNTSFLIAEGAQVKVPTGAQFLALGINDAIGLYGDNTGPGFRVKVTERAPGATGSLAPSILDNLDFTPTAYAQQRQQRDVIPIGEVMPRLCLNGYERNPKALVVSGKKRELYRYIGNVCWGILNVFPPDRSEKPDQGDTFQEPKKGCGGGKTSKGFLAPFLLAVLGIGVIGVMARRRR